MTHMPRIEIFAVCVAGLALAVFGCTNGLFLFPCLVLWAAFIGVRRCEGMIGYAGVSPVFEKGGLVQMLGQFKPKATPSESPIFSYRGEMRVSFSIAVLGAIGLWCLAASFYAFENGLNVLISLSSAIVLLWSGFYTGLFWPKAAWPAAGVTGLALLVCFLTASGAFQPVSLAAPVSENIWLGGVVQKSLPVSQASAVLSQYGFFVFMSGLGLFIFWAIWGMKRFMASYSRKEDAFGFLASLGCAAYLALFFQSTPVLYGLTLAFLTLAALFAGSLSLRTRPAYFYGV